MTHEKLHSLLLESGFTRIERDDRFLDVFPLESLEKGVELWEKWESTHILLRRVRLPFSIKRLSAYKIPRDVIEQALLHQEQLTLLSSWQIAQGSDSIIFIK